MNSNRTALALAIVVTTLILLSGTGGHSPAAELGAHPASSASAAIASSARIDPSVGPLTASLTVSPSSLTEGQSMNVETTATGGTPPYIYSYSGLPAGCGGQNQDTFSCNPSSTGTYTVQATARDSGTNQTQSNSVSVTITSSNGNGNGNGNGNNGGNNSSNPLSSLFSGFSGALSLVLIFGVIGFVTWILMLVAVWIIAITLVRRLPKRGASASAGPTVPCPACAASIPPGTKFCPECGASVVAKRP